MSTTKSKQKESFGPSLIQYCKFCSPHKNNTPSTVTRHHCSSLFHFTAVLLWMGSPLQWFPCGYHGIPAVPTTVQTSSLFIAVSE